MGGALYKSVKKRGVALSSVSVFNHKRAPMSRYSHSMSSKQISGKATTHNEATSSFKVKAWWHSNILNSTLSPWSWCSLQCAPHWICLCMQSCLVTMYNTKFLTSDMQTPNICSIRHTKLSSRVDADLSKLWTHTGNWKKSRGWALFHKTMVHQEM